MYIPISTTFCACLSVSADWASFLAAMCSAIAAIFSARVAHRQHLYTIQSDKDRKEDDLKRQLAEIIDISIRYPYLEHEHISSAWKKWKYRKPGCDISPDDEYYTRYEVYAERIFNFASRLYEMKGGRWQEMHEIVSLECWLPLHKSIWQDSLFHKDSEKSYPKAFVDCIDKLLNDSDQN